MQHINATKAGFREANMAIKIQDDIYEALENLDMVITSEHMYSPS